MNNDEYVDFLKSVLIKIENAINFIEQKPPKHILAYHKMLGVLQKINGLNEQYRCFMIIQYIKSRGIINLFTNGQYNESYVQILELKGILIKIILEIKNERDTVKKI